MLRVTQIYDACRSRPKNARHAANRLRMWFTVRPSIESLETRSLLSASLVADLNTTVGSSNPSAFTVVNSTGFFLADDGIHGRELWKTDGTSRGTHLVKDINPGGSSAFTFDPPSLLNVNGTLFLGVNAGTPGLWKSDGTAAGTVALATFRPSSLLAPSGDISDFADINGTLFFSFTRALDHNGLWRSDGTVSGTV